MQVASLSALLRWWVVLILKKQWSIGNRTSGLDRLAIAIGGNTIVPIASELLPQYLSAPEWQKHHAALITLAQIAEGCAKVSLI
jgi:hypothetical protein